MKEKFKDRNFVLQFIAWTVALIVLVGALVYYNFLAPSQTVETNLVGKDIPAFTLTRCYKSKNTKTEYVSTENDGKVTVINFWFTTCGPCITELPYFLEIKESYGDKINMVVIHSPDVTENVQTFLDNKGWSDYDVLFTQDTKAVNAYQQLGGKSGAYPMTVIVGADNVITFTQIGSLAEETLLSEIDKALANSLTVTA
jgi:thiol-disulfide isomerase/thioredoxin